MSALGMILIVIGIIFAVALQGLRKITADPPHAAVLTKWGKRINRIKKEGWRFFLFYPFVRGYIEVNAEKKNFDLKIQKVRTPDFAELEIPINITYTPDVRALKEVNVDWYKNLPLIEYLNSGGEKGINDILEDIVQERLRIWAIAHGEGPQTGEEALRARDEAVAILIKAIAGATLPPIPSDIPTNILLKYFAEPSIGPTDSERKEWGKNWEKVKEKINYLSPEKREQLKRVIEERRNLVKSLRQGNGVQPVPQLGIILNRLNIGEIKPLGRWAESLELVVKEKRERQAEVVELAHLKNRVEALKKSLNISNEQALEIIQTERGKVEKKIAENKWNISEETREMIKEVVPGTLAAMAKSLKGGA